MSLRTTRTSLVRARRTRIPPEDRSSPARAFRAEGAGGWAECGTASEGEAAPEAAPEGQTEGEAEEARDAGPEAVDGPGGEGDEEVGDPDDMDGRYRSCGGGPASGAESWTPGSWTTRKASRKASSCSEDIMPKKATSAAAALSLVDQASFISAAE